MSLSKTKFINNNNLDRVYQKQVFEIVDIFK